MKHIYRVGLYVIILLSYLFVGTHNVLAHKNSDSYLRINADKSNKTNTITGTWDIAIRDLSLVIELDENKNGEITWREILDAESNINAYLRRVLSLKYENKLCFLNFNSPKISQFSDGYYLSNAFESGCSSSQRSELVADNSFDLHIDYQFLFDLDAQHRARISFTQGESTQTGIVTYDLRSVNFKFNDARIIDTAREYILEGVWHIWKGADHILFLVVLLLPAVLVLRNKQWTAQNDLRRIVINTAKIVTAFTVAHSITLLLATFKIVEFSGGWVEPLIAASVIVGALNNIYPLVQKNLYLLVFAFGLVHGFGFAIVLQELGLATGSTVVALLAFNVGVELGQLVIVATLLPLIYTLRKYKAYQSAFLKMGSFSAIFVASFWLVERIYT